MFCHKCLNWTALSHTSLYIPFYFDLYLTPLFILNTLLILLKFTKQTNCTGFFSRFSSVHHQIYKYQIQNADDICFLVVVFTSKITMTQGTWSFAPSFLVFSSCIKPNPKKKTPLADMPCPSCAEFFTQVFPSTEVKSHTKYNINQNVLGGLPWHYAHLFSVDWSPQPNVFLLAKCHGTPQFEPSGRLIPTLPMFYISVGLYLLPTKFYIMT